MALLWRSLPHAALGAWYVLLTAASIVRAATRRRAMRSIGDDGRVPATLRATIVAVAVVWGPGVAFAASTVPHVQVALLWLMICGLIAAATSTQLADPATYMAYTGSMLLLSAAGVVPLLANREFVVGLAVIALYGLAMAALYRRRRALVQSLIT